MSQFTFDGTNNLSDAYTSLTAQLASGATLPVDAHVADASVFANATLPIALVLSPQTEDVNSEVEEVRITSIDVGANTVHITARGLDETGVATWPAGSIVSARLIGQHITDLQVAANSLGDLQDSSAAYEFTNFSEHYLNF